MHKYPPNLTGCYKSKLITHKHHTKLFLSSQYKTFIMEQLNTELYLCFHQSCHSHYVHPTFRFVFTLI